MLRITYLNILKTIEYRKVLADVMPMCVEKEFLTKTKPNKLKELNK